MISGYDIRENTLTPNSVFLLLLKADEKGCKDVLKDLSAFCKLIDTKIKGFDYVFELSGISDDSMLEKLRVKLDSISSSFLSDTLSKVQSDKTQTTTISSTRPGEAQIKKEQAGFFFSKGRKIEEEVITSLELKGESLSLAKDGTETKEEMTPVEKENQTVQPFSDEELKDVAISIEKKKSVFGGLFNKFKNALKSKKAPEGDNKGMRTLQEKSDELLKKAKGVKEKLASSNLLKKAQELKEKAKESDWVKQVKEEAAGMVQQAKDFKENISEEIKKEVDKKEEVKEEPQTKENPFQNLGSGIIVKKGLLQSEPEEIINQERLSETNPIEAKMQVDDIFAAETVCSFYSENKTEMPKIDHSQKPEEEKSPLEKLEAISNNKTENTVQEAELSNVHILLQPEKTEVREVKPEEEKKEGKDLRDIKVDVKAEDPHQEEKKKIEEAVSGQQGMLAKQEKKEDPNKETSFYDLTALLRTKAKTESLFLPKNKNPQQPKAEEKTKVIEENNIVEKTNVIEKTNVLEKTEQVKDVFVKLDTLGSLDLGEEKESLHIKTLYEEKKETPKEDTFLNKIGQMENPSGINTLGSLDAKGYVPLGGIPKDDYEEEEAMLKTIGAFDRKKKKPLPAKKNVEVPEIKDVWEQKAEPSSEQTTEKKEGEKKEEDKKEDILMAKIEAFDNQEEKKETIEEGQSFLEPKMEPEIKKIKDMEIPLDYDIDNEGKVSEEIKEEENIVEKDDVFNFEDKKEKDNVEKLEDISKPIMQQDSENKLEELLKEDKQVSVPAEIKEMLKTKTEAKKQADATKKEISSDKKGEVKLPEQKREEVAVQKPVDKKSEISIEKGEENKKEEPEQEEKKSLSDKLKNLFKKKEAKPVAVSLEQSEPIQKKEEIKDKETDKPEQIGQEEVKTEPQKPMVTKEEEQKQPEQKVEQPQSKVKEEKQEISVPKQVKEKEQEEKKVSEIVVKKEISAKEEKPTQQTNTIKETKQREEKPVSDIKESTKEKQQEEQKKPILQKTQKDQKEKKVMQENNNQNVTQTKTSQSQEVGKPFHNVSKTLVSKNFENIDHTLHIAVPPQGLKSKNYPIEMPMIPTYTFANMDNSPIRFAHAMGMSTLENLGVANNPLLLQGDSGTGKTHFLHAMGYEISKKIPQAKILFTNGVRFSRGIQCMLERGKKEKLDEFFNNVEVLIIDDIHLTAVNEHNREYISKLLNDFLKNKKQIIISSKYPPESLKRFEELVNFKLSVGAIAELKVPNSMHFSRLTKKMINNADISLTEEQIQEFFFEGNKSLGDVAKEIKRVKVLSRRIESSGLKKLSYEDILTAMTRVKGEDENSEIVKRDFESITSLQKHKGYIWGNFGFFFPSSEINKFRWVAFASQEAAKELGIKGGFNYSLKSAYSTEHIISAAFKIANICDVKGLKGAVIVGPSLTECKEPIRENFYDILTHMLEVMMIRCGTINFEDIKKPSAYVKMLGDILR